MLDTEGRRYIKWIHVQSGCVEKKTQDEIAHNGNSWGIRVKTGRNSGGTCKKWREIKKPKETKYKVIHGSSKHDFCMFSALWFICIILWNDIN